MKITFYAHASFRLEADGLAVVTDPYTPGPGQSGFDPIDEPADIVLMSSATDRFHSDPSHVLGEPVVVNTLELPSEGTVVKGLAVRAFPTYESLTFDFRAASNRDPDANALYLFELGGIRVLHMGDVGNPIADDQLDALAGQVDLLLALTGEHATIALDDLDRAIERIRPGAIIPMHYYSARGVLAIEPVERFLDRFPSGRVHRVGASSMELTRDMLRPEAPPVFVLEQSR
ncbi:MBL fold metallo-hydrolase [Aureimonas phyllosphaerae]|uniref:L-ascorbate metabolism protein UlaG (Beta-lactamase superfamily) n=1 Tax=Aureimonas phyllosphaerae TaxID=1166078 RepID=A0A7W6FSZ8_9HYPH|nr:MBL fold metallo-hydrolase [Aureimonas phyllosphaerae]MBB3934200.1 L-ascorbate metabolism protein UlaG (beta-lactamase superfamily) [Aureimonas phyllosphaerae]MBB3958584.1 L-ascorbate metabolism protein UlaG (beta-lactamase superfamily) [Aureimonas phyllosphaerae]SFE99226.1 L-ascorbate metabolism protein UlaG, beta-lactamase superfamily [Aureimonas phyllosphaerae]